MVGALYVERQRGRAVPTRFKLPVSNLKLFEKKKNQRKKLALRDRSLAACMEQREKGDPVQQIDFASMELVESEETIKCRKPSCGKHDPCGAHLNLTLQQSNMKVRLKLQKDTGAFPLFFATSMYWSPLCPGR